MMERKSVVFLGSDPIALPILNFLISLENWTLKAIFTQPDRKVGRGRKLQENQIKIWAKKHKIEVHQPEKLTNQTEDWFKNKQIDLALVMAYGHILKKSLLEVPPLGFWNFHTSLLPELRGAAPIAGALAQGLPQTGVSLMRIIPKMDAGPILDQEVCHIAVQDDQPSLSKKLSQSSVALLKRNISKLNQGNPELKEQQESKATYISKITKEDGRLQCQFSAVDIERLFRAYQPWPGLFFFIKGHRIKIGQIALESPLEYNAIPGQIVDIDLQKGIKIGTSDGFIYLQKLQRAGGKMLPFKDFLLGFSIDIGTFLD